MRRNIISKKTGKMGRDLLCLKEGCDYPVKVKTDKSKDMQ